VWDYPLTPDPSPARGEGVDSAAVAGDARVHPVIVHVAVEHLVPPAGLREGDGVTPIGRLAEAGHHDHVVAHPFDPAMEGQHPVVAVDLVDVQPAGGRGLPRPWRRTCRREAGRSPGR